MSILKKIITGSYLVFSGFNGTIIFVGNMSNIGDHLESYDKAKTAIYRIYTTFDNLLLISKFTAFIMIKSGIYAILGPVTTYRIALAHHNECLSGNDKWTHPLYKYYHSVNKSEYLPYIIYPIGNASWLPIKKDI